MIYGFIALVIIIGLAIRVRNQSIAQKIEEAKQKNIFLESAEKFFVDKINELETTSKLSVDIDKQQYKHLYTDDLLPDIDRILSKLLSGKDIKHVKQDLGSTYGTECQYVVHREYHRLVKTDGLKALEKWENLPDKII